jgi:hypothetical protein
MDVTMMKKRYGWHHGQTVPVCDWTITLNSTWKWGRESPRHTHTILIHDNICN